MASLRTLILSTGERRSQRIASYLLYAQKQHLKNKVIYTRVRCVHSKPTSGDGEDHTTGAMQEIQSTSQQSSNQSRLREKTVSINTAGRNTRGEDESPGEDSKDKRSFRLRSSPLFDAILTTAVGLSIVFLGGVAYLKWYKMNVLVKIENAFTAGYDPALELELAQRYAQRHLHDNVVDGSQDFQEPGSWINDLRRKEQDIIDSIVTGKEPGGYFMLLGPKGSGKGSMILRSMKACQADGVSMCDAHPDLEVFRQRLGKALNYDYNEDSQMGLFQRRDPKEGGPGLDVERGNTLLEKVALRVSQKAGRPLVLIINKVHHFKNDESGQAMLLQLQQKAEAWAACGILTMVFTSDDYWPYNFMRKTASHMHTVSIFDLDNAEAQRAATSLRTFIGHHPIGSETTEEVVGLTGGRLSYLSKVSRSRDMVGSAKHLMNIEKQWLMSQIGLIADCDDDVMDEQKWSSCSWLLLREFVRSWKDQEEERRKAFEDGKLEAEDIPSLPLPKIPYGKCRQIMTRTDFLEDLDRLNIISIDTHLDVRPDSMLVLHAAREICEEEGFDELLDSVRERIDEIESLHRTSELTFKDLRKGDKLRLSVDKGKT
ncbi:hypothetical protein AGABI1DRAFT_127148 [Agaricus bisporus var. burnettii JB137-S8]|uniref:AAA protein C-terminal winged helix domain-containing protein n=1 Tax=Agaricus bisporus var. burnettii (strain JB137-S8 / ATCC MYA-4627 / FGSC 10392) TaxID=597362 RepID=K5X025_AGABU|nr:uncharacterized protein AGABI1DRAFT_127148 [Agaricus bisporus var. burnettii JB137-S8]EKM81121.1 hypothetical protein AGABI1DRAFT_127148 [Agaricus bisporus var. burnettii JB137-S8]